MSRSIFSRTMCVLVAAVFTMSPVWADQGQQGQNGEQSGNSGKADLSRLVVVGDSLSAGFQNFSLYDGNTAPAPGGEQHGYAAVVAQQARVALVERLISYPGIPPALQLLSGQIVP